MSKMIRTLRADGVLEVGAGAQVDHLADQVVDLPGQLG